MNGRSLCIIYIPFSSPILNIPTPLSNLGKSQIILLTCLFWSCSWVEMLTAKADFPTPGDPLVQIILWPPVLLTSVLIAYRMSLWVPSIYDLHSLSFFPLSTLTFSATVFSFYDLKFSIHKCWPWITDNLSWIFEIAGMYRLDIICYSGWYYELDNLDNEYGHRDQALLYEYLYKKKISVKFICKSI